MGFDRSGWTVKRWWAAGLILGLAALLFPGCGGNNNSGPAVVQYGALFVFVGDVPAGDVLSYRANISTLTLRVQGSTDHNVTVFPTTTNAPSPFKLNFASLRDFSTILNLASMPEATYDVATISTTSPQIALYDPSQDPPIQKLLGTLSEASPEVPISPAFTIKKSEIHVLRIDFDLTRSLELDAQGQVTGNVNPVFKVAVVTPTDADGYGFFDDLVGFVRTVAPYPVGQNFTGSFTMQLLSGTGPTVTINIVDDPDNPNDPNKTTQLYGIPDGNGDGIPDLNQLPTGSVVEVGAYMDTNGNLVARTVQAEDRAVVELNQLAFLGYVLSATKDADGNVTQFQFYVREEEPDVSTAVPLDSVVTVNVSPDTTYHFASAPTNFADLPFDATSIVPGQELIVHGVFTLVTDEPTTVAANSIYLKVQTLQGKLGSLVQFGSDGKTGAFWLTPSMTLLQPTPVLVMTNSDTVFLNVFGLSQISHQATLLARGLPFYQAQTGTINGVAVPAGTLVVMTRQVHQLN
jgi:hypothetical protein